MRTEDRAARLMALYRMLAERSCTVAELACYFECHPTTIYRDLHSLQREPLAIPLLVHRDRWQVCDLQS